MGKTPDVQYTEREKRINDAIQTTDNYERLSQIKAPILIIAGAKDRLIQVENSKILASRIPDSELVILENSGHGFISDALEESSKAILDFFTATFQSST